MTESLADAIGRVVSSENCSGCGACALLSRDVTMVLDENGFTRPRIAPGAGADGDASLFSEICPGRTVAAPSTSPQTHPVLGGYVSAWDGWSVDSEMRFAGSSGGVLTALSTWMIESGRVSTVVGAASGPTRPSTTVPIRITTKEEALASSGSRYAPVGVAALLQLGVDGAVVGKPCEGSAIRQLALRRTPENMPVILSFFCAGTPSQWVTDELIASHGADPDTVTELRYRGRGWPGRFTGRDRAGREFSTSYEESWGQHLGRQLQWRCKVCVDGMGDHADISVGDFWHASAEGYPEFSDEPGRSVILARTVRGHELLMAAMQDGVVTLESIDLDAVARIQPLQVERKQLLAARLLGRRLAMRPVPRYPGYRLARLSLARPVAAFRSMVGTFRRSFTRGRS